MFSYKLAQWILFFYIYAFIGWIWEVCYVSAKQKKWTNRGFLSGPMLPIYGFGAIIILFATLPVKSNYILIFICGMTAATILEYISGVLMEALFKVRYWDYTKKFCNLQGHICLGASLGWGTFSILLTKFVHVPFEKVVLKIDYNIVVFVVIIITFVFAMDVYQSTRAALDLKAILQSITENHEEIRRMQHRLDFLIAIWDEDRQAFKEKVGEKTEAYLAELATLPENLPENLKPAEIMAELIELREGMKKRTEHLNVKKDIYIKRVGHVIKNNPMVQSKFFSEALEEVKELAHAKPLKKVKEMAKKVDSKK